MLFIVITIIFVSLSSIKLLINTYMCLVSGPVLACLSVRTLGPQLKNAQHNESLLMKLSLLNQYSLTTNCQIISDQINITDKLAAFSGFSI